VGAPVGPTGCDARQAKASTRAADRTWQLSAGYGQFTTNLHFFKDGFEPSLHEKMVVGAISHYFENGLGLRLGGGGIFAGELKKGDEKYKILPGFVVTLQLSKRILETRGLIPYIIGSLTAGVSAVKTRSDTSKDTRLVATDFKLAAAVGYTFFGFFSPYVSPRVFGGPVFWKHDDKKVIGTDRNHYQLAVGTSLLLPLGIDLYVDWSPLGEKSISAGAGLSF
jgi:hypothetical protein